MAKKILFLIGDVIILYLSLFLMLFIRYGLRVFSAETLDSHFLPFSLMFIGWVFILFLNDLYRLHNLRNNKEIFNKLLLSTLISVFISMVVFYIFGALLHLTPKTNLLIFGVIFLFLNYSWRVVALSIFSSEKTPIAIFGSSSDILKTTDYLKNNPQLGYELKFQIKTLRNIDYEIMRDKILKEKIKLLIIQPDLMQNSKLMKMAYELLPFGINLINFLDFYESIFERVALEAINLEWIAEHIYTYRPYYDRSKRIFEFTTSIVLLILLLPIMCLISSLIKFSSKGPVIYKQQRVGRNGKKFTLYKFRTMYHKNKGPLWTETQDQRITAFGNILRTSHLDEMPQLINIIKGDISIIGPRPERIELVENYKKLPYYNLRHIVKPGLSGWAQVNYKPSSSLEEAFEKLCYDIYYIKNRNPVLDLIIILKSIKYIFTSHK